HGSEERYRADKLRLFALPGVRAAVRPPGEGGGWSPVVPVAQIPLRGRHNAENVAAAVAAIEAAGFAVPPLPQALAGLRPLPHRLQTAHTEADGTEWVDDSISTTPESALAALAAFEGRPVVLIAGGSDRRQRYDALGRMLASRTQDTRLIVLPETGARIGEAAAAHGLRPDRMSTAGDMREATLLAQRLIVPGGVVLLSPAAPSFSQYANFEQRGDDFAACAKSVALRA
ncbi:MAG: glutamate ligase domain-containing protein, partial [Solirubrobacteraceae bacterium]